MLPEPTSLRSAPTSLSEAIEQFDTIRNELVEAAIEQRNDNLTRRWEECVHEYFAHSEKIHWQKDGF